MNVLDKIKVVQRGLAECGSDYYMCSKCPYYDRDMCRKELIREANEVINALRAELKKRASKEIKAKPGFIILTNTILYSSDDRPTIIDDNGKISVRVSDILLIKDLGMVEGSEIRLNNAQQTTFYVRETIEKILSKIADMIGGEEE